MYGFWILAIIISSIIVLCSCLIIIFLICEKNISKKIVYERTSSYLWGEPTKETKKYYKLKLNFSTTIKVLIGIAIVFLIILLFVCLIGGVETMFARKEYEEFIQMQEIVKIAYQEGNELDNISITNNIIAKNEWLATARASKKIYSNFSKYYYIDVENIKPISIKGE